MISSKQFLKFNQLSVDESIKTIGGNTQQNLIFLPIAIGVEIVSKVEPYLVDLYVRNSLFLNF